MKGTKRYKNKKVEIVRGSYKGQSGIVWLEKEDRIYIKGIKEYRQVNKRKSKDRTRSLYIHRSNVKLI